jgi:hypothetical protein
MGSLGLLKPVDPKVAMHLTQQEAINKIFADLLKKD